MAANAVGGLVNVRLYPPWCVSRPPPVNNPFWRWPCGVLAGMMFNFTLSSKLVFKGPI